MTTAATTRPTRTGATGRSRTRAGLLGVLVALAVAALVAVVGSPWVNVPLALLLMLGAPTARRLDRRLAVNLSMTAGLVPVALWVPTGSVTAAAAALGVSAGLVAAAAVGSPRRLVPELSPRDLFIALAATTAAAIAWPLRSTGSADRTLAMLSTGIDHGYHFAIFLENRLSAAGTGPLAANADPSGFGFYEYPQWFHKMLTVLSQAVHGDPGSASTELARYAQLEWVVFVGVAVLVTAALLQALPRDLAAVRVVPAVVVVLSLCLGVPGAINLIQGHLSFLLAASAPVVIGLLLAPARERLRPVTLAAVAALVLVAASWMLLLPLAAAAVLAPFVGGAWRRPSPGVRRAVLAACGALAVAAVVFVRPWLGAIGLQALLTDGTIPRLHPWALVAVLLGALGVIGWLRRRAVPATEGPDLTPHLVVSTVAVVQLVVLGGYMLAAVGELRYYFWKLALGSVLVSLVAVTHAVVATAHAGAARPARPSRARLTALTACLVAAVGIGPLLQDVAAPSAGWAAIVPVSLAGRPASGDAGDVDLVLRLAASTPPGRAARTRLIATRPDDMNTGHALVWFHALSHSATHRAMDENVLVYELADEPEDTALAVRIARETLVAPDRWVAVTSPQVHAAVVAGVSPEDAARVTLVR